VRSITQVLSERVALARWWLRSLHYFRVARHSLPKVRVQSFSIPGQRLYKGKKRAEGISNQNFRVRHFRRGVCPTNIGFFTETYVKSKDVDSVGRQSDGFTACNGGQPRIS
jgi:hypothetical protein